MKIISISEKIDHSYFKIKLEITKEESKFATEKSIVNAITKYLSKKYNEKNTDTIKTFVYNEMLFDDEDVPFSIEKNDDIILIDIGVSKAFIDAFNGKGLEPLRRNNVLLEVEHKEEFSKLINTSTFQLGKSVFNKIMKACKKGLSDFKYISKENGGYSYYKIDKHWWYCVGDGEFSNDTGYVTKNELNKLLNHC